MVSSTMRAIRVHRFGGPEELVLEEVARPDPQAGEVLVRVHAAGVLPAEWKLRQGRFLSSLSSPISPAARLLGVVAAVGPGVTLFQPGQAVFGRSTRGTYAEYTATTTEPPTLTRRSACWPTSPRRSAFEASGHDLRRRHYRLERAI